MSVCAPPPIENEPNRERSLIDELDLLTFPVTNWSSDQVVDLDDPDFRTTFTVTVTLTASVSVTWSW